MDFVLSELCDQVMTARAGHKPLFVMGGGSKSFYGNYRPVTPQDGHCLLDMTPYRGIVNYHPSELVVTVRAGTPLADLEAELAAHGQMLAFEPPHFGPAATVGGCVAAGLSAAPYERGRLARFRAGRAAAGFRRTHAVLRRRGHEECGRLRRVAPAGRFARHLRRPPGGVALLSPKPMQEVTLARPATQAQALSCFAQWRGKPLPVSATSWSGDADGGEGMLCVRLSGAPPALASARQQIGGDAMEPDAAQAWWRSLREQTHTFFEPGKPLWRLALPPTAAALDLGPTLLEWGGGQRWLCGNYEAAALRAPPAWAGTPRCSGRRACPCRRMACSIRWRQRWR